MSWILRIALFCICVEIDWLRKAQDELGEETVTRDETLKQLDERIAADKEIPNARRDRAFLLRFLRAKKFDVDKSFRMVGRWSLPSLEHLSDQILLPTIQFQVQKYFKMKRDSPNLFRVSPTSEMHDLLYMQIQQQLPYRDANGSVIYIFRVRKWSPWHIAILYLDLISSFSYFFATRKLWSVQMSGGKGIPK